MKSAKSGWALLNRVLSSRLGWMALFLAVALLDAIRGRLHAGLLVPGVLLSGLLGPYFWFTIKGLLSVSESSHRSTWGWEAAATKRSERRTRRGAKGNNV
jgi:hypothetical protein